MKKYLKDKLKDYTFEDLRILIENEEVIKVNGIWEEIEDIKYCEACGTYHLDDDFKYYNRESCDYWINDWNKGE